jgi:hypothetical protein
VLYPLSYGDVAQRGASEGSHGGAEGDRTLDLRIANATLSQLSYRPTTRAAILASMTGHVQWSFGERDLGICRCRCGVRNRQTGRDPGV